MPRWEACTDCSTAFEVAVDEDRAAWNLVRGVKVGIEPATGNVIYQNLIPGDASGIFPR